MERDTLPPGFSRDVGRFEEWAATYDRSVLQQVFFVPIHKRMLALLAREGALQSAPQCILDVGCGTGRLLRAMGARWPDAQLLGADPAEQMVAEARRLSPRAHVELARAESLPFGDGTVDIVTSSLSFHHWTDQGAGIAEIVRVLRAGGLFCLADHTFTPARSTGERPKTRRQVRSLMETAGLTLRRQRLAGMPFVLMSLAEK